MKKNLKYYTTALALDGIDFILGAIGWVFDLGTAGLGAIINNIRGLIYDAITIPIVYSKYGGIPALIDSAEIPIPDEVDFLIPIATISAYFGKRKK